MKNICIKWMMENCDSFDLEDLKPVFLLEGKARDASLLAIKKRQIINTDVELEAKKENDSMTNLVDI